MDLQSSMDNQEPGSLPFSKEVISLLAELHVTKTHEGLLIFRKLPNFRTVALTIFVHEGNLSGSQLPMFKSLQQMPPRIALLG